MTELPFLLFRIITIHGEKKKKIGLLHLLVLNVTMKDEASSWYSQY